MAVSAVLTTYIFSLCCASALGFVLMHPDATLLQDNSTIADVVKYMKSHASDIDAQEQACNQLTEIASHDREGSGRPFGFRAATKHLDGGIGEAFAQGGLNALSNTQASDDKKMSIAWACLQNIRLLVTQNHLEKGTHLWNHGGPLIWKAMVAFDTKNGDPNCDYAKIYGTPQPEEAAVGLGKAGGYAMILEQMEKNSGDTGYMSRALCALTDNVHSGVRAAAEIANAGGPLNGIKVLARMMPVALARKDIEVREMMVHNTAGLLRHDDAKHTYRNEFIRLGYIDHLMALMKDDPADNFLQDLSCQAIHHLTQDNDNATHLDKLANAGAIVNMAKSMTTLHSCSTALINFARASPKYLQKIKTLSQEFHLRSNNVELERLLKQ